MTKPLGDPITHYWLAKRMAQTVGVDLVAATESGAFSQEDWAETVNRCRGCEWTDGCQKWLPEHEDGADHAPRQCRNTKLFEALKV